MQDFPTMDLSFLLVIEYTFSVIALHHMKWKE